MKIALSLSVYEHAAALIGRSPWDVSRDEDLLVTAQGEAWRLYRHGPVVVGTDIYNLEAEAYGGSLRKPGGNGIPSITTPPCGSVDEVLRLRPLDPAVAGRIPMVIRAGKRLKRGFPHADIRIPISGPFSVAQGLLGLEELVISALTMPEAAGALLQWVVDGQIRLAQAVKEAGLDVVFFESAAAPPLLSPVQFRDVELPALKRAMEGVAAIVGHAVPCIIGGDTVSLVPYMMQTGTDFLICPAETDRVSFLAAMTAYPAARVRVNMKPEIYVNGPKERIAAEVDSIVALAAGRKNVLLGTGAIPYETPVDHVLFLKEYAAT